MSDLTGPALLRAAAERLLELDKEATKGPWEIGDTFNDVIGGPARVYFCDETRIEDRRMIVALRGLIPDLAGWLRYMHDNWDFDEGSDEHAENIARKVLGS